jgi:surface protein
MDVLRIVGGTRGQRTRSEKRALDLRTPEAGAIAATLGALGLGIGLAAYLRRTRELRHMDTGELLRKYKNATKETGTARDMGSAEEEKEKEDTKTAAEISEICVSRVHDLCDYLHGAYHHDAEDLLRKTLNRVKNALSTPSDENAPKSAKEAQVAFLKKVLEMRKEEWERTASERNARAIRRPLREIPIDEKGQNEEYGHVATWDVRRVTDMSDAFLTDRKVRNEVDMYTINRSLEDLTFWDTRNVKTMHQMFGNAREFNGDIGTWDTRNVKDMTRMFYGASSFDKDISTWDTGNVDSMEGMFARAEAFNRDLCWNTSNVTNMEGMFFAARRFNGDISKWDVSKVKSATAMFQNAIAFNQDISGWNPSSMQNMEFMFYSAALFNQDVSRWAIKAKRAVTSAKKDRMFLGADELSIENSQKVFIEWSLSDHDCFSMFGMGTDDMLGLAKFGSHRSYV